MNILALGLIIAGAVIGAATLWCVGAYMFVTAMEMIEKFMKRYFPAKYYYDWDEEV